MMKTNLKAASAVGLFALLVSSMLASAAMASPAVTINTVDSTDGTGADASLALDSSGNPVVSYYDDASRSLKLAVCGDPTCSAPATITTVADGYVGSGSSIKLDLADNPVISYFDASEGHLRLVACGNTMCSSDNNFATIDADGRVGADTSLELDASGRPVVSYYDITNGDLKIAVCGDPTCSMSNSVAAVDSAGDVGRDSDLLLDDVGYPVIAYLDNANIDLKLAACDDPTCTGTNTVTTVDSDGITGSDPSMVLNSFGNPVIGYRDGGTGDINVAVCGNPSCTASNAINSIDHDQSAGEPSLALDEAGNPIVSFGDSWYGMHVAICSDPVCSSNVIHPIDAVDGAGPTSMELDVDGDPVIAYSGATFGRLKLATADLNPSPSCDDDTTDPDATVTFPVNGATYEPDPMTFAGTATDNGCLARVDVTIRDRSTGKWLQPDGTWGKWATLDADLEYSDSNSARWKFGWTPPFDGEFGMSARAVDSSGNQDTARPWIKFTVAASEPAVPDMGVGMHFGRTSPSRGVGQVAFDADNYGDAATSGPTVLTFDLPEGVTADLPATGEATDDGWLCTPTECTKDTPIPAGKAAVIHVPLVVASDYDGSGTATVTVATPGDNNPANDSWTKPVASGGMDMEPSIEAPSEFTATEPSQVDFIIANVGEPFASELPNYASTRVSDFFAYIALPSGIEYQSAIATGDGGLNGCAPSGEIELLRCDFSQGPEVGESVTLHLSVSVEATAGALATIGVEVSQAPRASGQLEITRTNNTAAVDVPVTNSQPIVTVETPGRDSRHAADSLIRFQGSAEAGAGVARVQVAVKNVETGLWFRGDGTWGGFKWHDTVLSAPDAQTTNWSLDWMPSGTARYALMAKVTDTTGTLGEVKPWVPFYVVEPAVYADTTPPIATVEVPQSHATYALGGPFTLTGHVSDNLEVARVQIAIKDVDRGLWYRTDGWGTKFQFHDASVVDDTWSYTWTPTESGKYAVLVKAIDTASNPAAERPWVPFYIS